MSSAEMSAAVPNHRRTKPGGIKTVPVSSSGATGPNSQIPGLSQTADETSPVERTSGRRVGIFASDSEYVKLAKGGGHKGLLSHDDDEADDLPVTAYNPPNWFGDESKGGNKTASPGGVRMASRQPMAAPFGTDNSSSWESGDIISPDKEKFGLNSFGLHLLPALWLCTRYHIAVSRMTCCLASGFFNHFPLHDTLRLKFSSITPPFSSVTAICSTCPLADVS
uniref:Uncharacterized protein n=1 Tax=Gasterosteus aculeatus aculeatus TaxID=481459 RepID=A0AAQ4PFB7_GASAC